MKREKIMYLDVARILATFAVILVHIASMRPNWVTYGYDTPEWAIFSSFASITKWAAPLFCMISGALFLDPDRNVTIKGLYTRNIPRILVNFVFWSTILNIHYAMTFDFDWTKAEFIKRVANGRYHQWYLYMIIAFYVLVPILRKITSDKSATQYLIAVAVVFNTIIPFLQLHQKLDWTITVTKQMFFSLPAYLAYFLLGYYINKFDLKIITKLLVYLSGSISLILTVTRTVTESAKNGVYFKPYTDYTSLAILLQTVFVFVLLKDICSKINFKKSSQKTIASLSKDTLGIYQMHPAIIMILTESFGFTSTQLCSVEVSPLIAIPVILIITYVICEIISHILNKIPIVNKYLV